jgi:competence protein ComEC
MPWRPASFQAEAFWRASGLGSAEAAARRSPLLVAAFSGAGGIACADSGAYLAGVLALGALLFLAALLWRWRAGLAVVLFVSALSLALLGWRQQARLAGIEAFPLASALAAGQSPEVEGEAWVADGVERGGRSANTVLRLRSLVVGGREVPCDHRVPCWLQRPPEGLAYGVAVRFTGRLVPLEGPKVPGGFDARLFHFRQSGSLAKLEVRGGDRFEVLPGRPRPGFLRFCRDLRAGFEESLRLGVPADYEAYARLVAAMTLGAREQSPEELEELFRDSGTLHLFAVSGLHVGILASFLVGLASLCGVPRSWAAPAIIPILALYAILTGLSPSAVRAAAMASAFLAGFALREKPRLLNSLGLAALLLLAFDPQQLFLPGFQLSFVVLLSIALLAPGLKTAIARPLVADPFLPRRLVRPARRLADKLATGFAALLAVSLASWAGSAGLLAWHFQSVAPVAILANVVMVPLASVVIGIAAASLAASGLHLAWVAVALNRVNLGAALALSGAAQLFASVPGAMVHTGGREASPAPAGTLRLDLVGDRGDAAALIEFPPDDGGAPLRWMLDTGGSRTYKGRVLPLLRSRGVNRIDALVLTHGDEGHIGAAPAVMGQFRPRLLLESTAENRSPVHREILATAARLGTIRAELDRGQILRVGKESVVTVLHPSSLRPGRLADDRALVLKLTHAGRTLLFTSDSGFETEKALLEGGANLRAEVWIRGQHGESPSGLPAFVEAVRPRVVVSTNSDFPESERVPPSLRGQLRQRGIPLYTLDRAGCVTLEVTAESIRLSPHATPGEELLLPSPASPGGQPGPPTN